MSIIDHSDGITVYNEFALYDKESLDYYEEAELYHYEAINYNQNSGQVDNITSITRTLGTVQIYDGPRVGQRGWIEFSSEENLVKYRWSGQSQPIEINYGNGQSGPTADEV